MDDADKALGKGGFVNWHGQRLELTPLNFDMISELVATLKANAWDAAEIGKDRASVEVYHARLQAVGDRIASRAYAWGSKAMADFLASRDGEQELLYLMLRPKNPRIRREDVAMMFRDELEQTLARMAEANRNPDPLGAMPGGPASLSASPM